MKIKRFIIVEEGRGLFFYKRLLYGYSLQNQMVYKVKFGKDLETARRFYSELDADKFLDELPPNDHAVHICTSNCNSDLKLSNLTVRPITIVYDT